MGGLNATGSGEPTGPATRPPTGPPAVAGASSRGVPREAILLGLTVFAFISSNNILTPLLPVVRDDFGVSITTAGLVVGSYGLARLAIDLPAGFLADVVGHRRLSWIAVVMLVGSSLLGYWSPTVETLIVARILSGMAAGTLATVTINAMAAVATPANRGRVLSIFGVANNSGVAIFPLVGGLVGAAVGWRSTFLINAILAAVAGVVFLRLLSRIQLNKGGGRAGVIEAEPAIHGRERSLAVLATNVGVAAMMIHRTGLRNTILPLYAAAALGLGGVSIATGLALGAAAGLIVATPGGMAGDRFGRRRVILAGLTYVAIADLAFLLTNDLTTFLVVCLVLGLGDFFTATQTALLTDMVPATERTRTLSGYRFASDLGAMIGPIILAATMDAFDARTAIVLAVAILGAGALTTWRFVPGTVDAERIRRLAA